MKSIAMLLLMLACGTSLMVGCENREETAPITPGAPSDMAPGMPMEEDPSTTAPGVVPGAATAPTTQASAALAIVNQYCAVDGDHKIDPKVTTVHEGKTIGFCCEDCIPTFKKEPAKYLASLK